MGESKVLQYFSNATYNLAIPDSFTKLEKVTKNIGLSDSERN